MMKTGTSYGWMVLLRRLPSAGHCRKSSKRAIEELEIRVRERIADLEDANDFLEVLINAIPSPVFYKDAKGIYQGCNKAFEQYMGLSRRQIIGKSDYDMAPRELADKYQAMDRALFNNTGNRRL